MIVKCCQDIKNIFILLPVYVITPSVAYNFRVNLEHSSCMGVNILSHFIIFEYVHVVFTFANSYATNQRNEQTRLQDLSSDGFRV